MHFIFKTKRKIKCRVIFKRLAEALYRCPNNIGRGGRELDWGRVRALNSEGTEPALPQLIKVGAGGEKTEGKERPGFSLQQQYVEI